MQTLVSMLCHQAIFFIIILLYYFVPVSIFYYEFYIRNKDKWQHLKIQLQYPDRKQIQREIKSSIGAIFIFSFAAMTMYECSIRDYSMLYFNIDKYNWLYFVLSILINILVNDTFFYWTHRLMHLKWLFPYVHFSHHKSTCPTPFDVFAFHPSEAFIHGAVYTLLIFIIPIHPIAFCIFHLYNLLTNIARHGGFEFLTKTQHQHWFFNWQNRVTNHDVHHKKFNCNYGNYFIIWDKLMGTIEKD